MTWASWDNHEGLRQRALFERDGYIIVKDFWPPNLLAQYGLALKALFLMQGKKLGIEGYKSLDQIVLALEEKDKEAAYQACKMSEMSRTASALKASEDLNKVCNVLLENPDQVLLLHGPTPLINVPGAKRLLYRWHAETCFMPKRRNFLNLWSPFNGGKDEGNGTMWVAVGSHKQDNRQFIEYTGYDADSLNKRNHFIQYEIPERYIGHLGTRPIIAAEGDLVIFHANLVHASSENKSDRPSYAMVIRAADYRDDLTLHHEISIKPHHGLDYGRPEMRAMN